jgi:WD40 repeat protein
MLLAPLESRHRGRRLISKFKSDGSLRMVSCGLDGEIKVSSLESLESTVTSIYSDDDYLLAVDFNRTRLICGGMNGLIEVFSFN